MKTVRSCDEEVIALKGNPETPYWVRDVIDVALQKDSVDALLAFEKLAEVFNRRNEAIADQFVSYRRGLRKSDGLGCVE